MLRYCLLNFGSLYGSELLELRKKASLGDRCLFYVICYYILDFCLRRYQGNIVSGIREFLRIDSELLYYIRKKRFKQISLYFANHKTSKFQCNNQLHFAEHLQTLPRLLRIPSI